MSYILDALRRAQAERSRGDMPGLHTPAPSLAELPAARAPAFAVAPWLAAAALLALGLGAGGWWLGRAAAPAAPALAAAPQPGAAAPAPPAIAPPVAPPAAPPPWPSLPWRPRPPPRPLAAPRPRPAAPAPAPAQAAQPAPAPAKAQPQPPSQREAAPPAPPGEAHGAGRPAAPTVFAQADLPPAVREQLPTLQLAGITYSSNPLHRMAIVNGQVLHEGEQAAPGLVLERIEPGRAVWLFRGYRWALAAQ